MADNVQLDPGSGGQTIKTVQKSGAHVSVSAIDVGNHDADSVALIGNAGVYMPVTGAVADNTATSNNPVLVGAKYLATGTAVDDGDAAHLLTDSFRQLRTVLFSKDSNQEFSFHTADFDTDSSNPAVDVDFTSCIGIAVAGSGGAVALTGTTVGQDTGLDVNIVNAAITLAELPAGTNLIGKVDLGTTDSGNLSAIKTAVETLDNAVSGNEMQVDIVSGSVGITGTTQADITAIKTAVETIDNAVSGNEMQVDIVSGSVGITGTTQADITAIKTAVELIDNAVSGTEMQVDIVSGSVGITGTTQADITAIKTAVETIDNAVSGSEMQVDIVSGSVGITGTTQADITAIKTAVETIDNAVSGSQMQVDVVGSLPAGSNAIGKLAANDGVDIGDVDVTSISAGTNLIGDVGVQGRTTGGLTAHSKLDYVNTPVDVKSSAGTVYALTVFNMTASPFYIKMYDVAGSVNRASHTPVLRFAVPANASSSGAGFVFNVPQGIAFSNRIQYAITTGVADTDTSGISSGNAVVNIAYK